MKAGDNQLLQLLSAKHKQFNKLYLAVASIIVISLITFTLSYKYKDTQTTTFQYAAQIVTRQNVPSILGASEQDNTLGIKFFVASISKTLSSFFATLYLTNNDNIQLPGDNALTVIPVYATGPTGVKGPTGSTGIAIQGRRGSTGATGTQGIAGVKGDTGNGSQGATGVSGAVGATGTGNGSGGLFSELNNLLFPLYNVDRSLALGNITGSGLDSTSTESARIYLDASTGTASLSGSLILGNQQYIRSTFGPLQLQYKSGLDSWATSVYINDTTGNVGILTSPGASALTINGTNSVSRLIANSYTYTSQYGGIYNLSPFVDFGEGRGWSYNGTDNTGYYSDASNPIFALASGGNIGIGLTSPKAKLNILGTNPSVSTYALRINNTGYETIINTTDRNFSGAGNWTGTNWAVSSGVFQHTAGSTSNATLANTHLISGSIVSGKVYKVTYTVSGLTAGTITAKIGTAAGTATDGNGTATQYIQATATDADLNFTPTSTFDGALDNISVVPLPDLFNITNAGDVAIGTINPIAKFQIDGQASRGTNALALFNQTSTGDIFTASSSGTPRFTIANSGRIGIGTTTPAEMIDIWAADGDFDIRSVDNVESTTFHMYKARGSIGSEALVADGDNLFVFEGLGFDGVDYEQGAQIIAEIDGTPGSNDLPTRLTFGTTPDGTRNPIVRMTIKNNGSIGIGNLTPDGLFDVEGQRVGQALVQLNETGNQDIFVASASGSQRFSIGNDGSILHQVGYGNLTKSEYVGSESYYSYDIGAGESAYGTYSYLNVEAGPNGYGYGGLFVGSNGGGAGERIVGVRGSGTSETGALTNTSAGVMGRVGLYAAGNITLGAALYGQDGFDSGAGSITTQYGLYLESMTIGSANYQIYSAGTAPSYMAGRLGIGVDTTPEGLLEVDGERPGQALVQLNQTGSQDIITASASGTTRFTLQNDGDVGIGTITPAQKLDVEGNIQVGVGTDGCVEDADGTPIAGSCSSDERLKQDIVALPSMLAQLKQLSPVTYHWKEGLGKGNEEQIGLIAQDVERTLPQLVTVGSDGMRRIKFQYLPFIMIKGINELAQSVETLERKITSELTIPSELINRLTQTEQDIATLSAKLSESSNQSSIIIEDSPIATEVASLTTRLDGVEKLIQNLTSLITNQVEESSSSSGINTLSSLTQSISTNSASIIDTGLKVLGATSLADAIIAGDLLVSGSIRITPSGIVDINGILKLQGTVTIDDDGTVRATAIESRSIQASQFIGEGGTNAGRETLLAGSNSVQVTAAGVKEDSLILITAKDANPSNIYVSAQQNGTFIVSRNGDNSLPIRFDWFSIDIQNTTRTSNENKVN